MAIKGTILILAVLLSISTYVSSQNIECYNCGYREDASGKRTKIPMEYIDVPFCGEDNLSNSTAPHEPTFPGGCCSAYKIKEVDEATGDVHYISRFGSAQDMDEQWLNFTCGEVKEGYTCKDEHVKDGKYDEDGKVCHCYDNLCNVEVPDLSSAFMVTINTCLVFTAIMLAGLLK